MAGGISQLGFWTVEFKYLIIFHGLGEDICCPLSFLHTQIMSILSRARQSADAVRVWVLVLQGLHGGKYTGAALVSIQNGRTFSWSVNTRGSLGMLLNILLRSRDNQPAA